MLLEQVIFDLGMHTGQDTEFYLSKGFKVVAVEANPLLADAAASRFKKEIDAGSLTILNIGVTDKEGVFPFYINAKYSEWSSFDKEIGSREGCKDVVQVPTVPFEQLIHRFGIPYYLKIDIEGHDSTVLERLALVEARPRYISAENGFPPMIYQLVSLGYDKFKFINQASVTELVCPSPAREGIFVDWSFPFGSSGLFGEETPGVWKSADEILIEVESYWGNPSRDANVHGWYDVHARYSST